MRGPFRAFKTPMPRARPSISSLARRLTSSEPTADNTIPPSGTKLKEALITGKRGGGLVSVQRIELSGTHMACHLRQDLRHQAHLVHVQFVQQRSMEPTQAVWEIISSMSNGAEASMSETGTSSQP